MSILKTFGEFVLASRRNSALSALLFGFIPLFGWISNLIVALVTLRQGPKEGAWVLLWASIPEVLMLWMSIAPGELTVSVYLYAFLSSSACMWFMAAVLWYSISWQRVLEASLALGVITVLVTHALVPALEQQWYALYSQALTDIAQNQGMSAQLLGMNDATLRDQFIAEVKDSHFLQRLSAMTTGVLVGLMMVSGLIKLALARGWQAALFNPSGFRPELYTIRIHYATALLLMACWLASTMGIDLCSDILPVFLLIFLLAGLSFLHWQAARLKFGGVLLVVFYSVLVVFLGYLLDYAIMALVLVAFIDSFVNLRCRLS